MIIKGVHKVKSVDQKNKGGNIVLENNVNLWTWHESVLNEAQAAMECDCPLAFWGDITSREYQGKFFNNCNVESAKCLTVARIQEATAKNDPRDTGAEEDLPF